jgi:hypothetical protein
MLMVLLCALVSLGRSQMPEPQIMPRTDFVMARLAAF